MADEEKLAHGYDYDVIVIGGGSGGLACSRECAKLGAKVAVLDFVKPSPQDTKWGLGGTCVNVGCIPKKLMHTAALYGETVHDAKEGYGWKIENATHSWEDLVQSVQDHIMSLNWGYRVALRDEKIKYLNALGAFIDEHTVETTNKKGKKVNITAEKVIVAVGGRPTFPDEESCPGAKEFGISSDDIFSLQRAPGKTLVVGASYVALECAGFLAGVGFDTTVMVRSIFLRGFDQQCAEQIGEYMGNHGVKFIRPATPSKIEKLEDGKLKVTYQMKSGETLEDTYDTVLFAIGRTADTASLNLDTVGVKTNSRNKKIICENEATSNPNIFALGDNVDGMLELTPVAIQSGRLLAHRLCGASTKLMDYENVPTAVFTPLEYGACGLSEEDALEKYPDNIEVFHSYFQPLEHTIAHRDVNVVYGKMVVRKDDEVVVGLHYLGPNAGEVIQGYAVAIKAGAKKDHFDDTVGIHPTCSEEFTDMKISKSSGKDPKRTGC